MKKRMSLSSRRRRRASLGAVLSLSLVLGSALGNGALISWAEENPSGPGVTVTTYGDNLATKDSQKANQWQMVSGQYNGNTPDNKITVSSDGNVRVQKNVVPTDKENEFKVYLSADKRTVMSQETLTTFFANATYQATTANNYHAKDLGTTVYSMGGDTSVNVSGKSDSGYPNHAQFVIKDSSGNILAQNITLYWSKANNVTFFLKIDDTHYILTGVQVSKDSDNVCQLSSESEELIKNTMISSSQTSTVLTSVTDTLGAEFTYAGVDEGNADGAVTESSGTISWNISEKADVQQDISETTDAQGRTIKTIWSKNIAELVYNVHYTPFVSAGAGEDRIIAAINEPSLYTNDTTGEADVNQSAVLTYNYGSSSSTVDFPVPEVRGILHDIVLTKMDEQGNLLKDAVFDLYPSENADAQSIGQISSDENGIVRFPNLTYGTYYVRETTPPQGYEAVDTVWTVVIPENYPVNNGQYQVMTMDNGEYAANVLWDNGTAVNLKIIVPTGLSLNGSGKRTLGIGFAIVLLCAVFWLIRRKAMQDK